SFGLSRLGCSKTKGIPSRPSQKSIEVCRSAPTSVMWWTPCDCSLRMVIHVSSLVLDELRLVFAALERAERHQLDARREDQRFPNAPLDRRGEALGCCGTLLQFDGDGQRRLLLDAGRRRLDQDQAAYGGAEFRHDLADRGREDVHAAHD